MNGTTHEATAERQNSTPVTFIVSTVSADAARRVARCGGLADEGRAIGGRATGGR
jgi:hypothetical protein